MSIYMVMVALTLILGYLMPQEGPKRKQYIIVMALLHTCVCAFRYNHLTGDLMKYHAIYLTLPELGWLSDEVFQEGRNAGFYWLMKLMALLFNGDFQPLLILLAVFGEVVLAVVIYRYSSAPWMSYLVWNCMGFYLFGFSAIKQAAAMTGLMLAFIGIVERKPGFYLAMMVLSGLLHAPSLIFLPAYWLCRLRINPATLLMYLVAGFLMYHYRGVFVQLIIDFYYEEDALEMFSGEIGNRFTMLALFCVFGILFRGFRGRNFEALFHLMVVAAILQMLAGFNNVFTRLADYYFQFSVLYIPAIFFESPKEQERHTRLPAMFEFNRRSLKVLSMFIVVFVIWFYWTYNINITIDYAVDDYLNYRTMWYQPAG